MGLNKFNEATSNNITLSSIFDDTKYVEIQSKKFLKRFKGILHQCFKKIKITPTTHKELFNKQKVLKFKTDNQSKIELEKIGETLVDKLSEDLFGIVKEEVAKVKSE